MEDKMEVDTPKSDKSDSASDSGSGSGSDSEEVEWLAKGRARRSTAGQNMASLLDAEADDELALLFAEEEQDEEFESEVEASEEEGGEEADEMEMESSSDEDDQGPEAQGDELEGEKELEREAKRLAKKRKAEEGLRFTTLRKKVKIEPTAGGRTLTIPAPRPKKKSERISWLPTVEDGPTRSSSRRQTMQNKELTHARLKDSEEKRIRLIATMEEAAKRKEKLKPKQKTQADRLAEAAKTERLNSKSLNRWEEMEKRRGEEQKAKLQALHDRRLEGAVATFWSGIAKWVNGKLKQVGAKEVSRQPDRTYVRKIKDKEKGPDAVGLDPAKTDTDKKSDDAGGGADTKAVDLTTGSVKTEQQTQDGPSNDGVSKDGAKQITFAPPQGPESFLDGIHLYASMNEEATGSPAAADNTTGTVPSETQASLQPSHPPQQTSQPEGPSTQPQPSQKDAQPPPQAQPPAQEQPSAQEQTQPIQSIQKPADSSTKPNILPARPPTPPPPTIEYSSRNLMVLDNFESRSSHERNEYNIFFNARKPQKLQKPTQEICPITSRPARYRDPNTGVAYANSLAYREIRQTLNHRYAWSGMLGCFVGPIGVGARGVPERFLAPNAPPPQMVIMNGSASGNAKGADGIAGAAQS